MRSIIRALICVVLLAGICLAQIEVVSPTDSRLKGYTTVIPVKGMSTAAIQSLVVSPAEIPMWNYSVTAFDGNVYGGALLGRNPGLRAKSVTDIVLQVIPLKITINGNHHGSQLYDPTVADTCYTLSDNSHPSDVNLVTNSPMFQTNLYDGVHAPLMNGVDVTQGVPAQYVDAYLRANWWTLVQNTNFHLNFSVSVLPVQTITFNSSQADNYLGGNVDFNGCGHIGVVDIDVFDSAIQTMLHGVAGVNPSTFPMLLTNSVVEGIPGNQLFSNCCALGYHSGYYVGSRLQIYSPFSVSAVFGNISTISHEVAEAVMDPTTVNATPNWGNEGQTVGGCQNNLEVGDPLSPGFGTPTNPFVITQNGFTYTLQELAFFNWFFGGTNSGAGGGYSNHGTFTGHAITCPPGGF